MKEMPDGGVERRGKEFNVRLSAGPAGGDLAAATNFGDARPSTHPSMPAPLSVITLGGTVSPENIGVSARSSVSARVVSETRL
jgi:hypothetical protein